MTHLQLSITHPGCIVEYGPPGQETSKIHTAECGPKKLLCKPPYACAPLLQHVSHINYTPCLATHMPAAASRVPNVWLYAAGGRVAAKILLLKTTRNILVIKSPKRATKSATSCAHTSMEVALRTSCPVCRILMMGIASANVL